MSDPIPGWYPDPDPSASPGSSLRWWDGSAWTDHTSPVPRQAQQPPPHAQPYGQQAAPSYTQPYGQQQPQTYGAPSAYPYAPSAYGYADGKPRDFTPDGARIPSWGRRLAAYLVDRVLVGLLTGLMGFPWVSQVWSSYLDLIDETLRAAENGGPGPTSASVMDELAGPLLWLTAVGLLVSLVYHVGFLAWRRATPGKMMLGLQVRLRDRPDSLPLRANLLRWVTQFGVGVLGFAPYAGNLGGIYSLVDGLWPLWDGKKQAVHDKAAGTNVVLKAR